MKIIKTSLAFLLTLSTCFCAQAQDLHLGATLNLGVSTVTSTKSFPTTEAHYRPSWNLGAYAEKVFNPQTAIGINILWVQIQSKETSQNREIFEFNDKTQALEKVGVISDESKFHANYFGIPIYCRLSAKKFGVKFGLQALLGLFGGSSYKASGTLHGQPYVASSKSYLTGIRFFDWGPKVGIDYQLSSKCRIGLEYYYGLVSNLSILKGGKKRQATLGVSYEFY